MSSQETKQSNECKLVNFSVGLNIFSIDIFFYWKSYTFFTIYWQCQIEEKIGPLV